MDYRSLLVGAATAEAEMNPAIKALSEAGSVSTQPVTRSQDPPNPSGT